MERLATIRQYRHPQTVEYEEEDEPAQTPYVANPPTVCPSPAPGQLPPRYPHSSERDSPRRARLSRRPAIPCAGCGAHIDPAEPFVAVSCSSGTVRMAHQACIRCPCPECTTTVRAPVPVAATIFPAAAPGATQVGLWPFTEHIPVTQEHVRAFVERNRPILEQRPAYDHPSGTATTRRPSSVKLL